MPHGFMDEAMDDMRCRDNNKELQCMIMYEEEVVNNRSI